MKQNSNPDYPNAKQTYNSQKEMGSDLPPSSEAESITTPMFNSAEKKDLQQSEASKVEIQPNLQAELAASQEKYIRLYAEFENFRKRTLQEKVTWIEMAGEKILQQILPVVDDFERALTSLQQQNSSIEVLQEGIKLIYDKMLHLLEQAGVERMQLGKGSPFDSEFHEAITKIPVTEVALQGKVVDVVEKGYLLKNKILRYAKVIIGE